MDQTPSADMPTQIKGPNPGLLEFVTIIATMMALTALSIDCMLPALPAISDTYGLSDPNRAQLVVTFYMLGFSIGQLVYGPASDAFGRKPTVTVGLTVFALASIGAVVAGSFEVLLAARMLQGFGCGAPRVIGIAVVRDLYGGRNMARIMSFVMMVFIILPVLAPSIGEGFMQIGHWQWIFLFLLAISLALMAATLLRLPETRPPETRSKLSLAWLGSAIWEVAADRQTLGYTLATGFAFGCLLAYINSAQQIFVGIYDLGSYFPLVFGIIAIALAGAGWLNAHFVQRIGMRRLAHGALLGILAASTLNLILALSYDGAPPLSLFSLLLSATLFFFGFIMPNFNALAMEPQQHVAGTASSFFGCITTATAATLGWAVGQQFNDTAIPLTAGNVALSAAALTIVFVTERGRMFQPHTPQ